jgi:hypothetical protein
VSYPHGESQAEAGRGAVGVTKRPASALEDIMTTEQKIIRAKVGLLELAKQLGNVSQACKMMGYSRDISTASRSSTTRAANWLCRKSAARSQC